MSEDVSRRAVLLLVVIAVLASVLSTSMVMNAIYNITPGSDGGQDYQVPTGKVKLYVPSQPVGAAEGKVTLEVVNPLEGQ